MTKLPSKNLKKLPKAKATLPSLHVKGGELLGYMTTLAQKSKDTIPNASLIYGAASAALTVFSVYHLWSGGWFTAFLLLVLAGVMFGFALHFLRFPES